MSDRAEMEAAIEAILFVAAEPVPRPRLLELFEEAEREAAEAALAAVLERYRGNDGDGDGDGGGRGVMLEEVAGGVRFVTRPEMGVWLRRFFDVALGNKLSMAALETLAIIAYRQPVTGPEIQELRSVSPAGVLKTLLEKRLVRIAGRKEVVGKPFLYATTREFLVHFGLNSLRDLPPLEEFEETFGSLAAAGGGAESGGGEAWGGEGGGAGTAGLGTGPLATPDGGGGDGTGLGDSGGHPEWRGGGPEGRDVVTDDDAIRAADDDEDREERILREAAAIAERDESDSDGLVDEAEPAAAAVAEVVGDAAEADRAAPAAPDAKSDPRHGEEGDE